MNNQESAASGTPPWAYLSTPLGSKSALLLSVSGGIFLGLCFKFSLLSWAAWFAVVPLFYILVSERTLHAVLYSFLFGATFVLVQSGWLLAIDVVSPALIFLAWILLAVEQGIFFGLFAVIYKGAVHRYVDMRGRWIISTTVLFMAMHSARTEGVFGYPFGSLASTQKDLHVLGSASIWGEYGLTFIMVLFSVLVLRFWLELRGGTKRAVLRKLLAGATLLFALNYGLGTLGYDPAGEATKIRSSEDSIEVAMVQPSIPQKMKMDEEKAGENKERLLELSSQALEENQGLDILIWPETSTPLSFNDDPQLRMLLGEMLKGTDTELVAGSFNRDGDRVYNAAYHVSSDGKIEGIYNKMKLVPFSEFLPFRTLLKPTGIFNYSPGDISPGREFKIFDGAGYNFSVIICYESLSSENARQMVLHGADAIFVLTNDAWFHRTNELEEHLQGSRLRAIENGRYVVQSANTGLTAVIDPAGELTSLGDIEKAQVVHGAFRPITKRTLFTRYGHFLPFFNLFLLPVLLFWPRPQHIKVENVKLDSKTT